MNNIDELKSLSDDDLLRRLSDVLARSRRVEWVLVAHIAEVDARRLYAREGSPSMYQYCIDVLHLSESEAYRRIAAARLSRSYPVILEMLEDGRLHLAGISVLSKHLTDANYEDVLARATHKTKREIEILVAELAPKPDVPPTIRKRPERTKQVRAAGAVDIAEELCPDRVECAADPAGRSKGACDGTTGASALQSRVHRKRGAPRQDQTTRGAHARPDLAAVMEAAVTEKLERLEAKRYGKTKRREKRRGC